MQNHIYIYSNRDIFHNEYINYAKNFQYLLEY